MTLLPLLALLACGERQPAPEPPAPEPPAEPPPARVEPPPAAAADLSLDSAAGPITVTPIYHSTVMVKAGDKVVWLDPWSKGKLDGRDKADILLLSDVHPDHLDTAAIDLVVKDTTVVVGPAGVAAELGDQVDHTLANGETLELDGITVTAVPMYNAVRGPEGGDVFHEKGRGNGYLLKVGGKTLYFAGDTECTDEMKALTGIDVAFLPMNLPYTMTPEEAAGCARAMNPGLVVPYHYAGSDLAAFASALDGAVAVKSLDFYPGGLPW